METQVAVLATEVRNLKAEIDGLKADVHELRETFTSGSRDQVMRLVTFAISIGTAIFVLRGGR